VVQPGKPNVRPPYYNLKVKNTQRIEVQFSPQLRHLCDLHWRIFKSYFIWKAYGDCQRLWTFESIPVREQQWSQSAMRFPRG